MNGKTRRGWLIVLALALTVGVGGTGRVKLGSGTALGGAGGPGGKTLVTNGYIACC